MGCALASELARAGASVTVVDQGQICSGSSGRNSGGVRQQFSSEVNVRLARRTIERVTGFAEEFGIDPRFQQVGYLFMASESSEQQVRAAAEVQRALDVPTRFISPDEITELVPGIVTHDLAGGAFCPTDGFLDPHSLVTGFAADARRHGARILQNSPVVALELHGDRVGSARLGDGSLLGLDVLVNCAGVWSVEIARLYGGELPILPWRSQAFVIENVPDFGPRLPFTIDFDNGKTYFHGEGRGLLAGMNNESAGDLSFDVPFDWTRVDELVTHLVHRLPVLEQATVTTGWAGFLELTADENPIVGWTDLENVYTAAGFSGHGLSIAPALAEQIARELAGLDTLVSLDDYRPERFARGNVHVEALSMR